MSLSVISTEQAFEPWKLFTATVKELNKVGLNAPAKLIFRNARGLAGSAGHLASVYISLPQRKPGV